MNDIFGRIFSIMLAAVMLVGIPLLAMMERVKTAEQIYLLTEETQFIDSVCNIGFVSKGMYEQLQQEIASLPGIYEIEVLIERKDLQYEEGTASYVSRYWDTKEIESLLRKNGSFECYRNDFIRILITKVNTHSYFYGIEDQTVQVFYGGTVKYEAY